MDALLAWLAKAGGTKLGAFLFQKLLKQPSIRLAKAMDDAVRVASSSPSSPTLLISEYTLSALDSAAGKGQSLIRDRLAAILGEARLPTEAEITEMLVTAWRRRRGNADAQTHEFFTALESEAAAALVGFARHLSVALIGVFPELSQAEQVRAAQSDLYGRRTRVADPTVVERYREKVRKTTATFYVPLLRADVGSQHAYSVVVPREVRSSDGDDDDDDESDSTQTASKTFADELERYHEPVDRSWRKETDALKVIRRRRLVVIVGGPGAGKSTLCRKLVHAESTGGQTVFFVRFKSVADRPATESFDAALHRVAASETAVEEAAHIDPHIVVIDALDECDPDRARAARELVAWADDHLDIRVVVTTRRVGHEASLLPGFAEYDLPHLEEHDLSAVAWPLIAASVPDESRRRQTFQTLLDDVINRGVVRGLALRTPLLLTFIVRLIIDGKRLGEDRVSVYSQIVDAIGAPPPAGEPGILVVRRAAEAVAFASIEDRSLPGRALLERAAAILADAKVPSRNDEDVIEASVRYWEERRMIERVSAGLVQSYTFMHLTLSEYLASKVVLRMNDAALDVWLRHYADAARWRETIKFAATSSEADRILVSLLTAVDGTDPATTAPILAAECVAERGGISQLVLDEIVSTLMKRLDSDIQFVVEEAAASLADLSQSAPERVRNAAAHLTIAADLQRRSIGIGLVTAAGGEVTPEQARLFLDAFHTPPSERGPRGGLMLHRPKVAMIEPLWRRALPFLVSVLLENDNSDATRKYLKERVFNSHAGSTLSTVTQAVRKFGDSTWFDDASEKWESRFRLWSILESHEKDLLRWYGRVLGSEPQIVSVMPRDVPVHADDFPILGGLFTALGLGPMPVGNVRYLADQPVTEEVIEVMRGVIAAIGVTQEEALREIHEAYARLETIEFAPYILYALAGDLVVDWSRVRDVHLDTRLLLQALHHPSIIIVEAAVELLAGGAWHGDLVAPLTGLLRSDDEWLRNASAAVLSDALPPEEALRILESRLDEPGAAAHAYIYRCLADLYPNLGADERRAIEKRLYAGILSATSVSAHSAARTLLWLKLPSDRRRDTDLVSAFEHWKTAEYQCDRCRTPIPTDQTSCPIRKCGTVPNTPLRPLLLEMARLDLAPSFEELLFLFNSRWKTVRDAARLLAKTRLAVDNSLRANIIRKVSSANSKDDDLLVKLLLQLPREILSQNKTELLQLACDSVHHIAVLKSLPNGWTDMDAASEAARAAMTSGNKSVREAGVSVLRLVRQAEA